MSTIYNVADVAKVSIKTVSRVMNEESKVRLDTRERVLKAMKALDYYPSIAARTMVTQKTGLVGLITSAITSASKVPELAGLPSIDLVKGIQSVMKASGKTLMIADTGGVMEHSEKLAQTFREHRVEGMIYVSDFNQRIKTPSSFKDIPSVLVNCYDSSENTPAVAPNDEIGGFKMAEAAIKKGHRIIGFLSLPTERIAGINRQRGFRRAHKEFDIPLNEDLIIPCSKDGANFEAENKLMREGLNRILSFENRPTAICCGNDRMAMNLYKLLNQLGISIPEDISVVGFDNYMMISELLEPGLTTVELPYTEIGQRGGEKLLSFIEGDEEETENFLEMIPGEVVWRNSLDAI
tara:strand:+ start:487 stop:1539 length:1053 start_codon:yes stop_codon:yes gene_type:complete